MRYTEINVINADFEGRIAKSYYNKERDQTKKRIKIKTKRNDSIS